MHRNVDILKAAGELPVEEQLIHMRLQWLGHVDGCPTTAPRSNSSGADHRGREEGQVELHSGGLTWSAGTWWG